MKAAMKVAIIKKSKKQVIQIQIQAQTLMKKKSQILKYRKTNLKNQLMRKRWVQKSISQLLNFQISI
jgi:hypothetical protein